MYWALASQNTAITMVNALCILSIMRVRSFAGVHPLSAPVYIHGHLFAQGAPESILDRCSHVRINGMEKVCMTTELKEQIIEVVQRYGTGKRIVLLDFVRREGCGHVEAIIL